MLTIDELISKAKELSLNHWTKPELDIMTKLASEAVNGNITCSSIVRLYKESLEVGEPLQGLSNKSINAFNLKLRKIYRELKSEAK